MFRDPYHNLLKAQHWISPSVCRMTSQLPPSESKGFQSYPSACSAPCPDSSGTRLHSRNIPDASCYYGGAYRLCFASALHAHALDSIGMRHAPHVGLDGMIDLFMIVDHAQLVLSPMLVSEHFTACLHR